VHLINFCGSGQGIALKSATALILNVGQHAKKTTAHSGTFGFARHTSRTFTKPKEPEFLPPRLRHFK
ncbi:MAG: hypothetical protein KDE33_09550, partial [Bacteroidetes bacterium]|nr:hypothetical protein [Bacteroidota bacterium]